MKISQTIIVSSILGSSVCVNTTVAFAADITKPTVGDVQFTQSKTPLTIDRASNFQFGQQTISAAEANYKAAQDTAADGKTKVPNSIEVTDIRGTNAGWKLQVAQGAQFTSTGSAKQVLTGAELSLENVIVSKTVPENQATAPTGNTNKITLVPGTASANGAASDVMVAKQDSGMGTWKASFGDDQTSQTSINLKVPGATAKATDAKYETTITWTLADTPA